MRSILFEYSDAYERMRRSTALSCDIMRSFRPRMIWKLLTKSHFLDEFVKDCAVPVLHNASYKLTMRVSDDTLLRDSVEKLSTLLFCQALKFQRSLLDRTRF